MQNTMTSSHSRGWDIIMVILLLVQGVAGLYFSLSQLQKLLAPGSPVIVTGLNIFTGPIAGIAFVVAIGSLVMIWGWWTHQHWAVERMLFIEGISLIVGGVEFIEPHLPHIVAIARVALAVVLLLCLLAARTGHRHTSQTVSTSV